jgi:hypothetical protein
MNGKIRCGKYSSPGNREEIPGIRSFYHAAGTGRWMMREVHFSRCRRLTPVTISGGQSGFFSGIDRACVLKSGNQKDKNATEFLELTYTRRYELNFCQTYLTGECHGGGSEAPQLDKMFNKVDKNNFSPGKFEKNGLEEIRTPDLRHVKATS